MKKILITLSFITLIGTAYAQDNTNTLVGDRPNVTESAFTIKQGHLQLETGIFYSHTSETINEFNNNTTLVRWGIAPNAEIRFGVAISRLKKERESETYMPFYLGTKIKLQDKDGHKPQLAFILSSGGQKIADHIEFTPGIIWAAEFEFSKHIALGVNAGVNYSTLDMKPSGVLSASLGIDMTELGSCFVETAWFPSPIRKDALLNIGYTYLIGPNVKADTILGFGLLADSPLVNWGAGVIILF